MNSEQYARFRARVDSAMWVWRNSLTNAETHPEWYLNSTQEVNMAMLGLPSEALHKRDVCKKCIRRDGERERERQSERC